MTTPESREANKFKYWEAYAVRERREMILKTYEYVCPFKYPNVDVERSIIGGEPHGFELGVVPDGLLEERVYGTGHNDGRQNNAYADGIVITEDAPIIRVAVIGSACTPPGYVTLEGHPVDGWRNEDEVVEAMPVRMRVENLWGQHLRFDQALETSGDSAGRPLPDKIPERWKTFATGTRLTSREFPLAGMSSAIFETPPCTSVRVSAGSTNIGWKTDNCPDDHHYSIRMIRVTLDTGQDR
ncbi:MAG: hypothetical protein CMJ81_11240 [Planctomycetaceae bacterium]|jgi:hypothetical protein|nr:hypothetical protein [Planctomycetaceae bacterium]MBP63644.1 hypothetical protein [Planctomycetaceae bacterium]